MEIHERLKKMRVDAGLTQTQLGAKIGKGGYKKHHISAIENNKVPIGSKLLNDWQLACGLEATFKVEKIKKYKKVT